MTDAAAPPAHATRPASPAPGQPQFSWLTRVYFDELDAMGMLHNSRYLVLAERAESAFFEANGWRWQADPLLNPDQFYVVRDQSIRYLQPVVGPCDLAVEMWLTRLGDTSATYAFRVHSGNRQSLHAEIRRTQVKLDPATLRPAAWTPRLRESLRALLRAGTD